MSIVAPSLADSLDQGQAEMQFRRPDLALAEGDVTVADLHAAAAMADAVIRFAVKLFKATFIDTAEEQDLVDLVNDHLNIQASPATRATAAVVFSRTSAGAAGTIPFGQTVATLTDVNGKSIAYALDAAVTIAGGSNGPFAGNVTAEETGPDGNVAADKITQIVGTLFDPTLAVTNPTAAGGGNAKESQEELRERARTFWQTLRRGTLRAIEYGALQVPAIRIAAASEDSISGLVNVLVSDADGNSTLAMELDAAVELEKWRSAGVHVEVMGSMPLLVDLQLGLEVRTGFDVAAAQDTLIDAVTVRLKRLRGNEKMFRDMVRGAVIAQYPDDILAVHFLSVTVGGVLVADNLDPIAPGLGHVIRPGTISLVEVTG